MQVGDWISLAGVMVTAVGLGYAVYGIHRSNENSSAASLLTFNELARAGWERFLAETDATARKHQFADLANLLETACALNLKGIFVGVSRELLTEYLDSVLDLLNDSDESRRLLEDLIHSPTTFKYLRIYLERRKTAFPMAQSPSPAAEETV